MLLSLDLVRIPVTAQCRRGGGSPVGHPESRILLRTSLLSGSMDTAEQRKDSLRREISVIEQENPRARLSFESRKTHLVLRASDRTYHKPLLSNRDL